MKQVDVLWNALRGVNKRLDSVEDRVAHAIEPSAAESRETPFIITEKFIFNPREPNFQVSEQTIVSSAGVKTKITRLNYACYVRSDVGQGLIPPPGVPIISDTAMRPTSRGLVLATGVGGNGPVPIGPYENDNQEDIAMFDFEWNLSIGSTEREYAKVYGDLFRGFCCRDSLANYEQLDSLIINEDHPLILGSNEFLIFKVRPTLFNFFFTPFQDPALQGEVVLTVNAIGYRSLSDV